MDGRRHRKYGRDNKPILRINRGKQRRISALGTATMGIYHSQNISSQAKLTSARPAMTGAMLASRRPKDAV